MASPDNATQRYLYQLNIKTQQLTKITPAELKGINDYDIAPSARYAVHRHQNSNTPSTGSLINLPLHDTKNVLYDNEPLKETLSKLNLPKVEFFKVTTADGVEMDGKMIKPEDFDENKKYPVLFQVYGEPAGQTAIATMDNLWHLYLAQQGLLVITLDNRGTPSLKGATWRKSIYRNMGIINARDQAMAAKEILNWNFIDAQHIGVWGWSGGGAMTLNLMFQYAEIYKTGIAVAAVTNQLFYDNIYQERYMGLPSENPDDFVKGSPATHAAGLQGNLLYIHGTGDDNVHYQNAEFLINALIRENKVFDLMIYPNRSHGIYEGQNTSRHLYTTMTNYIKKHLLLKLESMK
jgi:dipeptidyl-peptidase-4